MSDLPRINRALKANHHISLEDKLKGYQGASRFWRRHLSQQEIVLITYIVDRTVGWGKNLFTASHENVLKGTLEFSGVGLPERTYFRALASLEEKGLIERRSYRDRTRIVLNLDWQPASTEVRPVADPATSSHAEECHTGSLRSIASGTPRTACAAVENCQNGTPELPNRQRDYSRGNTVVRIR